MLISPVSDTIILRLMYIHDTAGLSFLSLEIWDIVKLDIDKNIKQPKSNLPEEALQVRIFQIMPFIYFLAKP